MSEIPPRSALATLGHYRLRRAGRAAERVCRSHDAAERTSGCPFCAGNEAETPAAAGLLSAGGNGAWTVRVVPNKYPAVTADEARYANCELLSPSPASGGRQPVSAGTK
jgi:galactose-1-phosphate uridylyltransferase